MTNENQTTLHGLQGHWQKEIQGPATRGLSGTGLPVLAAVATADNPWPWRHVQSASMSKYVWQMTWNPMTKEMTFEKIGQRHERLPKMKVRKAFDPVMRDILRGLIRNTTRKDGVI